MKKDLTRRQIVLWFVMYQLGDAFLLTPRFMTKMAKQDAWMSILVAVGFFLLLTPLYAAIAKMQRGESLPAFLNRRFGKIIGKLFTFVFVMCFPYLIFVLSLTGLSEFIETVIFPETPGLVIRASMLLAVFYALRKGLTVIGRSAEILFPVVIALFCLGYLSLFPSGQFVNLLPLFENGWKPIVGASLDLLAYPYAEAVLFLFLVPSVESSEKWKSLLIKSALTSGGIFLIMTILSIAALSDGVIANLMYPSYFVVGIISYKDFFERFEVIVSVLWFITTFFQMTLLAYAASHGIAEVFQMKDNRSLLVPLLLIALVMSISILPNASMVIESLQAWPVYALFFGIVFPLFLLLIGKKPKANGIKQNG
ncbi:GerAB/ArcD/ProY family transporter [Gorillibacterium massiliense]|uniref:GerAB/ArcD/ProY family transporter n=1 Tax=Gorillibacterium massiliense TaxID=1280390 RepID=UPI0004B3DA1E|nr:endospore germination permease [Gorillibacterium massiliense]